MKNKKEIFAGIVIIGNEILSGRTKDLNTSTISSWLNGIGIRVLEVRVVPDVEEKIIGSAEILEIFKVSKVGKVAGSKVTTGEINQDSLARVIRDGTVVFTGKIGSIFREKNQAKQVSAGLECGITIKNFNDFQKKDIIEAYNSKVTERRI